MSSLHRGKWQRLADMTRSELDEVYVAVTQESPDQCVVSLTYIGGLPVNRFKRTLMLNSSGVTVQDEMPQTFVEEIPELLFDGDAESDPDMEPNRASVCLRGERQTITVLAEGEGGLELTERSGLSRNGKTGCLQFATQGKLTSYRVSLSKAE